jgi:anaphase-promoting complex subunit 5
MRQQYTDLLRKLTAEYLDSLDSFISSFALIAQPLSLTSLTALPDHPPPNTVVQGSMGIKASSKVGVYIRSLVLGFDQCSFSTAGKLYTACKTYVNNHFQEGGKASLPPSTPSMPPSISTPLLFHRPLGQISSTIQESCLNIATELGTDATLFPTLSSKLQSLQQHHPSHPLPHFMSYLNHLHHNSYPLALDSLHRYFDYTHSQTCHQPIQYSLTALAYLHNHFGHKALSLLATSESIRVAHQSNDPACVAYALAWLRASSDGGTGDDVEDGVGNEGIAELVARGHIRAAESNLSHLTTTSRLSMAVTNTKLCPHNPAVSLGLLDGITTNNISIPESLSLASKASLVESSIWESVGHNTLSSVYAKVSYNENEGGVTSDDRAIGVCKESGGLLRGFCDTADGSTTYHTALWHLHDNFYKKFPNPVSTLFPHSYAQTLHSYLLSKHQLSDASSLLLLLLSVSPLHRHGAGIEQHVAAMTAAIELLSKQGRYEQALSVNDKMCILCNRFKLRVQHANLLIQRAEVFSKSEGGEVRSIQPLMRCLAICDAAGLFTVHSIALLALAKINLRLNEHKRARVLVTHSLPRLLEHADVSRQGEAWMVLAKCKIASEEEDWFDETLYFVDNAEKAYTKCGSAEGRRDVAYVKALVYNQFGDFAKRDECAEQFAQLGVACSN